MLRRQVLKNFRLIFNQNKRNYSKTDECLYSKVSNINMERYLLHEYVWRNLDKWPDKIALECGATGRRYTFHQVYKKSKSLATFLRNTMQLKQNDVVAIIMPIIPEYTIACLGILAGGLKATLVNPSYTPGEMSEQLRGSSAKLVITSIDCYTSVVNAFNIINTQMAIIALNHEQFDSIPRGAINFFEICNRPFDENLNVTNAYDEVAFLPYSSGTTGKPKAVELTHNSIVANLYQTQHSSFRLIQETSGNDQDTVPCVLPLFHIYGLLCITFNAFSLGAKTVTLPKFTSKGFVKLLENHPPHVLYVVPPMVLMIVNNENIKNSYFQNLRMAMSAAAPLGAPDIERFYDKTNNKAILLQMYGLTEASPIITSQTNQITGGIKIGGSGVLVPNTMLKIVDSDDPQNNHLGINKLGEILMKGPQIMKGYRNNDEATKTTIVDNDWLRTGDIGYYDDDGQLFITDRLKELIKVKGFQVAPAELEEILRDHPNVIDAAIIGIKHPTFGEVPKAFVVTKSKNLSEDQLKDYVASKVAPYKKLIGGVTFIDEIPRTISGKILRKELKLL